MEEIFKRRLREEIRLSGLTKKEIAAKVYITPETLRRYCTTSKLPSLPTLCLLCKTLDVSADYLLGLKDEYC